MLKKVIKIENTGKLKNCIAEGDTQFKKNTVIFGTNGDGKSTFCSVLRSLSENDPGYVMGRKTLGQDNDPKIEIRCEGRNVSFDDGSWSGNAPKVAVYDDAFIEQNIYAGNAVDATQRRGLYRVIIGKEGVELARKEEELTQSVKAQTSLVTAKENEIKAHIPQGIDIKRFLPLKKDDTIEQKIGLQEKRLASIQQAASVKVQAGFEKIDLPLVPKSLVEILGKTLADVEADAEKKIEAHILKHKMSKVGSAWLVEGVDYIIDEECPFCAQDVTGNEQVAAYRAIFSDEYKKLKADISDLRDVCAKEFGSVSSAAINLSIEKNKTAFEFWKKFTQIDPKTLTVPDELTAKLEPVGSEAVSLLEKKLGAPLEELAISEDLAKAIGVFNKDLATPVQTYNEAVDAANKIIANIKDDAGNSDVLSETTKLNALIAIQRRHDPAIDQVCKSYEKLQKNLDTEKKEKDKARENLETYTKEVMPLFESRINDLLDDFNATFTVTKTSHSFAGGQVSTNYQLCINGATISLGNPNTPKEEPSFKNTLSAGDRSTLALAFFLIALENHPDKADMVAVFDDPFTSQDRFRKLNTIFEIRRMARELAQVIVLSHDESFLKDYWEMCDAGGRKSLKFHNQGEEAGSIIMECDIEELCMARTETERQKLLAFYHENVGDPYDVVQKMRTVLETYFKSTYPVNFQNQEWLGDICKKIRDDGKGGPAWCHYERVSRINDYTSGFHHGEDMTTIDRTIPIDPQELKGFVKWTLKILNIL